MQKDPLRIKRRGDDGTRVITLRVPEELLHELDKAVAETNLSRNELINRILRYGLDNLEVE